MVVNVLSQIVALLGMIVVKSTGLAPMKADYGFDKDFPSDLKASKEPWNCDKTPYLDYFM